MGKLRNIQKKLVADHYDRVRRGIPSRLVCCRTASHISVWKPCGPLAILPRCLPSDDDDDNVKRPLSQDVLSSLTTTTAVAAASSQSKSEPASVSVLKVDHTVSNSRRKKIWKIIRDLYMTVDEQSNKWKMV